jgi:hypothetical protein
VGVFASFFQVLHSVMVNRDCADRLCWVSSKKEMFKVRSFRSLACSEGRRFPWKSVWRTKAPSMAFVFAWSAALGKIFIVDNLKKRHIIIVNTCFLCKRDEESVNHILPHCDVASALWNNIFTRFGMSWDLPRRVINLFACLWKSRRPRRLIDLFACLEGKKS